MTPSSTLCLAAVQFKAPTPLRLLPSVSLFREWGRHTISCIILRKMVSHGETFCMKSVHWPSSFLSEWLESHSGG